MSEANHPTPEQPISRAAQAVLQRMIEAHDKDDFENAELVCDGGECWVGYRRTSRAIVNELLRAVLIRDVGEQGKRMERYSINEDSRKAAVDPTWRPPEMRGLVR